MPWLSVEARLIFIANDTRLHSKSKEGLLSIQQCLCLPRQAEPCVILLDCADVYTYVHPILLYVVENWVMSAKAERLEREVANTTFTLARNTVLVRYSTVWYD